MTGYRIGAAAQSDLGEIWDYIAQDNPDAADRCMGRLFEAFALLAEHPGLGHKREDLTRLPLLFWPVGSYLVLYRRGKTALQIAAVIHGARDVPALLRDRARFL